MFQGLRTAIYHVSDIERGKQWYSKVLGIEPYFDQPFYVGYNVSGYELGLQPSNPHRAKDLTAQLLTGASKMRKPLSKNSSNSE